MGSSKLLQVDAGRKEKKRKRDREFVVQNSSAGESENALGTSKIEEEKQIRKKLKLARKAEKAVRKAEKNASTNGAEVLSTDAVLGGVDVEKVAQNGTSEETREALREKRELKKQAKRDAKREAEKNVIANPPPAANTAQVIKAEGKKDKKENNEKRRERKEKRMADTSLTNGNVKLEAKEAVNVEGRLNSQDVKGAGNKQRFIVFIGNLPYTATTESIAAHFASIHPDSIRHSTHKDEPTKSKGFAFLEFDNYDRMKTVLKLFHHSMFEDGTSPGRKINVELTAGGGGSKSKERKTKIQGKNEKLNEERKRRSEEEAKAKLEKRLDGTGGMGNIHPSRMGRVPGS